MVTRSGSTGRIDGVEFVGPQAAARRGEKEAKTAGGVCFLGGLSNLKFSQLFLEALFYGSEDWKVLDLLDMLLRS